MLNATARALTHADVFDPGGRAVQVDPTALHASTQSAPGSEIAQSSPVSPQTASAGGDGGGAGGEGGGGGEGGEEGGGERGGERGGIDGGGGSDGGGREGGAEGGSGWHGQNRRDKLSEAPQENGVLASVL